MELAALTMEWVVWLAHFLCSFPLWQWHCPLGQFNSSQYKMGCEACALPGFCIAFTAGFWRVEVWGCFKGCRPDLEFLWRSSPFKPLEGFRYIYPHSIWYLSKLTQRKSFLFLFLFFFLHLKMLGFYSLGSILWHLLFSLMITSYSHMK